MTAELLEHLDVLGREGDPGAQCLPVGNDSANLSIPSFRHRKACGCCGSVHILLRIVPWAMPWRPGPPAGVMAAC
ncbi:hypothetical protein I552_6642 [Mycobacterium xenopi 3993]|nr:hypothetical protein I552_6642 [Mycobacterium xenopi 3993]